MIVLVTAFLRLLYVLVFLFALVVLIAAGALVVDYVQTGYLRTTALQEREVATASDPGETTVISSVHIIPMDKDTVLTDRVVIMQNGEIRHILKTEDVWGDADPGQAIQDPSLRESAPLLRNLPDQTLWVDGQNRYLMPGLIDMHVHIWDRHELGLYLANGVTAVRNAWGMPMHLRMKEDAQRGAIFSPLIYTSGPKLTGPTYDDPSNLRLTSSEQARERVMAYKKQGYDFIKTYYGLTEELFETIVDQAVRSGMDIMSHPTPNVPYAAHFHPQIRSVEHAEDIVQQPLGYTTDAARLDSVILEFEEAIAERPGQPPHFCPTLTVFHNIHRMIQDPHILSSDAMLYMNPLIRKVDSQAQFDRWQSTLQRDPATAERILEQHQFHLEIIRKLHRAGVPVISGSDAGIGVTAPGFSIHRELAFYAEAGLSNYEVLKTATVNAAATHHRMNHLGTVAPGKTANLLLLNGNPLEDLTVLENPEVVFILGRMLDRDTLEMFRERAHHRKNGLVTGLRYLENWVREM